MGEVETSSSIPFPLSHPNTRFQNSIWLLPGCATWLLKGHVHCRLDKRKFFVVGIGLFSGVTTALFPLSVIKTRQMAAHSQVPAGISGSKLHSTADMED